MNQKPDFPFCIEDVVHLVGLHIRRPCGDGVYTDCPFCGDNRGKLKVNYVEDVWRCNYCQKGGGVLHLYAYIHNTSLQVAYREICEAMMNGVIISSTPLTPQSSVQEYAVKESHRAAPNVIHATYTAMLDQLTLKKEHREHLRTIRGLSDEEIDRLGFKSTPPFYLCRSITERLIGLGHTVEGVPGFYQKDGKWTLNFCSYTAGILLPAKSIDGNIAGFQIRLDVPLKNDGDEPEKSGAKYIWLSSSGKTGGYSSGSPVHVIGNRYAKTVYVTEGVLKADIAHCLTGRTFAAIAGANNLSSLDELFKIISRSGTQLIVEAHDMDKYRNEMVDKGASAINMLAHRYGMDCRRLTWNPNYKGIDDWQLALKRKSQQKEGETTDLQTNGTEQHFRVYQLDFEDDHQTKKFAFEGIDALHKAGYEQPPASEYRLIHDGCIVCGSDDSDDLRLERIFIKYNDTLPHNYRGRSISPSDVVELYDEEKRRYFYRDRDSFCSVKFSPFLAKPMNIG